MEVEPWEVGDKTVVGPCEGEPNKGAVEEVHREGDTSHEHESGV